MSLDTTVLRILNTREKYDKMIRAVPKTALGEVSQVLLDDFGKFYRQFPDAPGITEDAFRTWFRAFGHPKLSAEQFARYDAVIKTISQPAPPELEEGFAQRLLAADTASKLADLLERYNEGEEIDLGASLRSTVDQYELDSNRKVKTPWVRDHINDLLEDDALDRGFHWRQPGINAVMRPLISGDFGIIAARPDVGKTSFLTDNLTHFAGQMREVYEDGDTRNILWFNNEGPGRRIKKRLYQSALDAQYSDLLKLQQQGKLVDAYAESLGGDEDRIRIFDIHDFWNYEVEDIIKQHNPGMVVFDMLDNIKFGGGVNNNGQRTDQLLEAMYQWGRVLAVKHDCVVLATSQISAEGENLAWPTLSMLKDSKTGKQGAADFIMTIGFQNGQPDERYLGLTKNKLNREGGPKQLKLETVFDGGRGRYRERPSALETASDEASSDPTES